MKSSKSPHNLVGLNREIFPRVGPSPPRQPTGAARKCGKRLDTVLVAVLSMDGFAGAKVDGLPCHFHTLALEACEMHFDAMTLAVIKGVMFKSIEAECAPELAINSREQIKIELCGDPLSVVIGSVEDID